MGATLGVTWGVTSAHRSHPEETLCLSAFQGHWGVTLDVSWKKPLDFFAIAFEILSTYSHLKLQFRPLAV